MRALARLALAATTAAAAVAVTAAPAHAYRYPIPCEAVTIGSCYVHDPDGSYTCTIAYVEVGRTLQLCLLEWSP